MLCPLPPRTSLHLHPCKRDITSQEAPPILERLGLSSDTWCELVGNFGRLFHNVAGCPTVLDRLASLRTHRRYRLPRRARQPPEAP
jgi:hypothetical protein